MVKKKVVFKKTKEEIKKLIVDSIKLLKKLVLEKLQYANVRLEYSPESFTGTELDFALNICETVCSILGASPDNQVIIKLLNSVEMSTPNVYADQIEWIYSHFTHRDNICISLHLHNDRGTAIAAAELGLMVGADRIEGCLFGNGERAGNVCLVTLALNLFTQGIDPKVYYNNLPKTIQIYKECTELKVQERYPWAGSLIYTAFSGSHQDAIKKGLEIIKLEKLEK